jgi:hypothetical protein
MGGPCKWPTIHMMFQIKTDNYGLIDVSQTNPFDEMMYSVFNGIQLSYDWYGSDINLEVIEEYSHFYIVEMDRVRDLIDNDAYFQLLTNAGKAMSCWNLYKKEEKGSITIPQLHSLYGFVNDLDLLQFKLMV